MFDAEWIKVVSTNISVAGVLLIWIRWLLLERKTDREERGKREDFWADREDKALKKIEELNVQALQQQKEYLQFLRDFKEAMDKANATVGINSLMSLTEKIAQKHGIDITERLR